MRDEKVELPYIESVAGGTQISKINVDDIFGTSLPNSSLYFSFESKFTPFERHVSDGLESIDVVIMDNLSKEPLRPLEIK